MMQAGSWRSLGDIQVPVGFGDMFEGIPRDAFRADISSTELRRAGKGLS